jgi:hypothetical protein
LEVKLLPKQSKQQRQEDAYNDGGGDGEVKSKLFSPDNDVTGKPADPWDLPPNHKKNADDDDKDTYENEHFS